MVVMCLLKMMRFKHPLDQVNCEVLPAYNCGWGVYSAHALWYHYSRTCLHRTPVASTRRVVFLLFFPIFFLRWVSSVICVGRARGARPSSAPPPLSRPFWGKGEGHAARTYAKNIHHSWWIIRYLPTPDSRRLEGRGQG